MSGNEIAQTVPPGASAMERGRTVEQEAWAVVHNYGPDWWNAYTREFPNSKASEQRKRELMAHYCVVRAIEAAKAEGFRDGYAQSKKDGWCPWHNGYHRNYICEHGYGASSLNEIETAKRLGRAEMREAIVQLLQQRMMKWGDEYNRDLPCSLTVRNELSGSMYAIRALPDAPAPE
jgi:hypothetical protein